MSVLLFGAKGFMGQKFLEIYPDSEAPDVDIADASAVAAVLDDRKPDVVINAAGRTGRPNIDWCEEHKEETVRANVTGPLVLLHECLKRGVYLVHLSSGCIYEGDNGGRGFSEDDPPNFTGSFYAKTKIWSEQVLREFGDHGVLILRLRMPFDRVDGERNLITKLTRYSRVLDVQNSLTSLPDFLTVASALIERRATGVYNVVNPGTVSPYEIMKLYKEIVQPDHAFERLTLADLPAVVRAGRSNCILNTEKLQQAGFALRPVWEALREALASLAAARSAAAVSG